MMSFGDNSKGPVSGMLSAAFGRLDSAFAPFVAAGRKPAPPSLLSNDSASQLPPASAAAAKSLLGS